jgi:integrase
VEQEPPDEKDAKVKTRAIQAVATALRRAGVADSEIEATLQTLGLAPHIPEPDKKARKLIRTAAQVAAAQPGVWRVDGAIGLYLRKSGPDTGSYFFRYWFGGARRAMGLGSIDEITLAEARDRADELKCERKSRDPIEARRQKKADAKAEAEEEARKAATPTIEAAIMTYLEANAPSWRHPYARTNWLNPIRTYALPVIGSLKVDAVESRHILAVMTAMDEAGVPVLARKVRSRLKTVFDYLAAHGLRDAALSNPADAGVIGAGRPKTETATEHYRRIALDDAPGVFARLMALASDSVAIAAWTWMILTAARPGEALAARWDQIDRNKKLWLNPAPKTKKVKKAKGKAETTEPLPVPLSDLALAVLDMQLRTGDLIFPGRNGGKLVYTTFVTALNKVDVGVDAGAPHSWRSIFRDVVEDKCGFRRETAEAALGHSLGAVEGAYRRETAVEARIPMMQAYAQWLLGTAVENILAFPTRA